MHRCLSSLLALTLPLIAPEALIAQGRRIPTAEELDSARTDVVRVMAERMLRSVGGDISHASSQVMAAAFEAEDRATRYLLWRQAIEMAEKDFRIALALQYDRTFANDFGLDPDRTGLELLKRQAAATKDVNRIANISLTALSAASDHRLDDGDKTMLAFYDLAMRTALRTNHAPLYSYVRDQLTNLRAPRTLGKLLATSLHDSPWPADVVVSGLLQGETRMFEPFVLRDFKALFQGFGELPLDRASNSLTPDEMIMLSEHATDKRMKTGMLRCAQQRLQRDYLGANEKTRRESCRKIVKLAERLCQIDGLSCLHFENDSKLAHLSYANGEWSTKDGKLIGQAKGANNFATHRINFSVANTVVIRGGIGSKAGLNFRCKAGDVNLLLNWEVEPQNHLWINGACHRTTPPALTASEEHTILIFTDGAYAHVCIDDKHMWTVNSHLAGTVSVYPALGSEIFVREILIDGTPAGMVDAPLGVMM